VARARKAVIICLFQGSFRLPYEEWIALKEDVGRAARGVVAILVKAGRTRMVVMEVSRKGRVQAVFRMQN
jgi:hypothetical protein